jgi:hypothetical protein
LSSSNKKHFFDHGYATKKMPEYPAIVFSFAPHYKKKKDDKT